MSIFAKWLWVFACLTCLAVQLSPGIASAACPPVLTDSLVPGFGGYNDFGGAGLSMEVDRFGQTTYAIVAAQSSGLGRSLAAQYSTSTHGYLASQYVDVTTTATTVPDVAAGWSPNYRWLFAWDGDENGGRTTYHNKLTYGFGMPSEEYETFDTPGYVVDPAISAFPTTGRHAVVGTLVLNGVAKTILRTYDSSTFAPVSAQRVLDLSGDLLRPPSIHGFGAGSSDYVVVGWNFGSTVKFALFDSSGTPQGAVRSISGVGTNVAVLGSSAGLVIAFQRSGAIYYQTWPLTGAIPLSGQVRVSEIGFSALYPRMTIGTWSGQTYFGIGWRTLIDSVNAYPTFALYRSVSAAPTLVSGPNYSSFYPEDLYFQYSRDPSDVQIFTGCSTGIVVAMAHHADSAIVPSQERGVRRSATLVTSGNLMALAGNAHAVDSVDMDAQNPNLGPWEAAYTGVVYSSTLKEEP
jgi:hypothetical protein